MRRNLSVAALVLLIFISGILVGLLLPKPYFMRAMLFNNRVEKSTMMPPPGDGPSAAVEGRMMNVLTDRLNLSDDQREPFLVLIREQRRGMMEITQEGRMKARRQIDSLNYVVDEQLKDLLDERQMNMWKQFRKRVERGGGPRPDKGRFRNPN